MIEIYLSSFNIKINEMKKAFTCSFVKATSVCLKLLIGKKYAQDVQNIR